MIKYIHEGGSKNPSVIVKNGVLQYDLGMYSALGSATTNPFKVQSNGNTVSAHELLLTIDVTKYKTLTVKGTVRTWYKGGMIPAIGFSKVLPTANNNDFTVNIGKAYVIDAPATRSDRREGNFDMTIDISSDTGLVMLTFSVSGTADWSGVLTFTDIYFK